MVRRIKDLTGKTIRTLTVISMAAERGGHGQILWNCSCSCGGSRVVQGSAFKRGDYAGCAQCSKSTCRKDLTGMVVGQLEVISLSKEKGKQGQVQWVCKCTCGNLRIVNADKLSSGRCRICKRCSRSNQKDRPLVMLRREYSQIKKVHRRNKWSGEAISFKLFKEILFRHCFYCGITHSKEIRERKNRQGKRMSDTVINTNGIDRIDSSKGYIEGNVVTCCTTCNTAKMDTPLDEFKEHIKKIHDHLFDRAEKPSNPIPKALKPRKKPRVRYQHRSQDRYSNTQRTVYQGPGT